MHIHTCTHQYECTYTNTIPKSYHRQCTFTYHFITKLTYTHTYIHTWYVPSTEITSAFAISKFPSPNRTTGLPSPWILITSPTLTVPVAACFLYGPYSVLQELSYCMHVCMCVCMYIFACVFVFHVWLVLGTPWAFLSYVRMYVCMCVCMYVFASVCMCAACFKYGSYSVHHELSCCMYKEMHVCIYVCMHTCVLMTSVNVNTSSCACVHNSDMVVGTGKHCFFSKYRPRKEHWAGAMHAFMFA
jgi:hypothetical protein